MDDGSPDWSDGISDGKAEGIDDGSSDWSVVN